MHESSVTTPDRRQTPRTKLVEIAYIGMGPENGGLVLDVSDGGLSFHAVAPVQPAETIHFLLSLRGHSRIEGAGEVVWTNQMKTVCGLRFTSLSGDARENLTDWTNQSRMGARMAAPARVKTRVETFVAASQTASPASYAAPRDAIAAPVFAIPPAAASPLSIPKNRTLWQGPFFFWILFGFLAAALAVTAFIYGVHMGKSEISSMARPAEDLTAQTGSPISAPAPVPASSVASDTPVVPAAAASPATAAASVPSGAPVNAAKIDDASGSAIKRPVAEATSAATPDQRAELQLEAGQSELAAALAYLGAASDKRDSSKAARLLWAAVANGNSTAEVVLAGLYLRGDGVAKSCEQGRVLLNAAVKSGNVEAQEKLQELNATGCQ